MNQGGKCSIIKEHLNTKKQTVGVAHADTPSVIAIVKSIPKMKTSAVAQGGDCPNERARLLTSFMMSVILSGLVAKMMGLATTAHCE